MVDAYSSPSFSARIMVKEPQASISTQRNRRENRFLNGVNHRSILHMSFVPVNENKSTKSCIIGMVGIRC